VPRPILKIAGGRGTELEFEVRSERRRANSPHKLDTLIAALRVFRKGLEEEFAEYDRRERASSRSRRASEPQSRNGVGRRSLRRPTPRLARAAVGALSQS
jgi:hypothetical protein